MNWSASPLLDSASLRAVGQRLISDELVLFGVRHHSPGCAWHVQQLFASHPPSVVLVEGPQSFDTLIPSLVHPQARLPLAIYTYAAQAGEGGVRRAAYYPFCEYSPEWVALREAAKRGIAARFIDLEYAEQCALESATTASDHECLLDERHYGRSDHLQRLAGQLGCRDHEALWEHLFEVPATRRDWREHLIAVAGYCQLTRLDCTASQLQADGTLAREAQMAWEIQQALATRAPGDGPVLVVLGGLHAVALADLLAAPVARPARQAGGDGEQGCALIRYSFDRLERLNGYAAGMSAPAWHQRVWEAQLKQIGQGQAAPARARQHAALEVLFEVAAEVREHQIALPLPAISAAYEQVLRLTTLRGRDAPTRVDVEDAIISCFIQGDADAEGAWVRQAAQRCFTGHALGQVPPGTLTPPLVQDVLNRVWRQRLKVHDTQPRRVVLDLYRRAEHRRTSQMLHGLALLDIPFAYRLRGPDFASGHAVHLLQEHWEYSWSGNTEAALVEASMMGVSLPQAVAWRFAQQLEGAMRDGKADAQAATSLMVQACVLGLQGQLDLVLSWLSEALGADGQFDRLVAAAGSLAVLLEAREPLQTAGLAGLGAMLARAYERAIYLGGQAPGQGDPMGYIQCLLHLRELLLGPAGHGLESELYWHMVSSAYQRPANALVRGACAGLLYLATRLSPAQLASDLAGHLRGLAEPQQAVAFVRGLLATARETAWQLPELLRVLDTLFAEWGQEQFVACLPELRLAFADLTPRETDRVASQVAALHGGRDLGSLRADAVTAEQMQANLRASGQLLQVLAADGLDGWVNA
ncbi:DUF5682 family protein [Pseudomonas sp. TE3610]